MTDTILKIDNLSKGFHAVRACENISLEINKNEVHALIGPNGAGKSTLIKLITGFLEQEYGKIFLDNKEISYLTPEERAQKGIARSFQVSSIINNFSVVQNIKLALIGKNKNYLDFLTNINLNKKLLKEAFYYLEEVGLNKKANELASSLSHGEKRKLEICIAISMAPKIFLFDEPMAGLDGESSELILQLFKKIKKRAPILLIEHDMDTVFSLADRVSVLDYGKVIVTGTVSEIKKNKTVKKVYLGTEH